MARTRKKGGRYTVGDHPGYDSPRAALSYALNVSKIVEDGTSVYVRDLDGTAIYRVDKVGKSSRVYVLKEVPR